jgi:hypothetical protein
VCRKLKQAAAAHPVPFTSKVAQRFCSLQAGCLAAACLAPDRATSSEYAQLGANLLLPTQPCHNQFWVIITTAMMASDADVQIYFITCCQIIGAPCPAVYTGCYGLIW